MCTGVRSHVFRTIDYGFRVYTPAQPLNPKRLSVVLGVAGRRAARLGAAENHA